MVARNNNNGTNSPSPSIVRELLHRQQSHRALLAEDSDSDYSHEEVANKKGTQKGSTNWCCIFLCSIFLSGMVIGGAFFVKSRLDAAKELENKTETQQEEKNVNKVQKKSKFLKSVNSIKKSDEKSNEASTDVVQEVETSDKAVQVDETEAPKEKKLLKEHHDADYHAHEPPMKFDHVLPGLCGISGSWCCKSEEDGAGCSWQRTCAWGVGLHLTHKATYLWPQSFFEWRKETSEHAGWCDWKWTDAWVATTSWCLLFTIVAWLIMCWVGCTTDDTFEKIFIFAVVA